MSEIFKKLSIVEKSTDFRRAVRVVSVPLIQPKDDEVLVKVNYVGVNASDINASAARYFPNQHLPLDIGFEALGVIVEVGKEVTTLKVGQPVVYYAVFVSRAYTEYLYAKPEELTPVPEVKPELIGLFIGGLTAAIGLDEMGRIKAGEKVLITAAAGGTGHMAVQWAKQKGCYVIGVTSSEEKAKMLKELGTDRVIKYKTENMDEVLTKEFPSGVDVIRDTIGGQVLQTLFKHLAVKGRLLIVGGTDGYKKDGIPNVQFPNLTKTLLMKNQSLNGFLLTIHEELHPKYIKQLIGDLQSNKLRVVLDLGQNTSDGPFNGIESVVRGVEHLHSSQNIGKVVVKIQD